MEIFSIKLEPNELQISTELNISVCDMASTHQQTQMRYRLINSVKRDQFLPPN